MGGGHYAGITGSSFPDINIDKMTGKARIVGNTNKTLAPEWKAETPKNPPSPIMKINDGVRTKDCTEGTMSNKKLKVRSPPPELDPINLKI